jgi:hypothetical protein
MLKRGGDFDFAEESLAAKGGRELGPEELDGDATPVLQVLSEKDDSHSSLAKLSLDSVPIPERGNELLEEVHDRPS